MKNEELFSFPLDAERRRRMFWLGIYFGVGLALAGVIFHFSSNEDEEDLSRWEMLFAVGLFALAWPIGFALLAWEARRE